MPQVEPNIVDANGARIHYALEGRVGKPILVLSNSLGTNFQMWDPQAAAFQKSFRLLRYDTRGHGKSSVTQGPYSIEQLAKDVLALADALKIDRFHFCGLSMGGMIGMWLGANASHRLGKLVLCNTAAKIGSAEMWNTRIETVRKQGMKPVAAAAIERWFSPAFRQKNPPSIASTHKTLEETSLEGYAANCAAVRDFDFRERLCAIRTSTLVISGTHDPATPPADGQFLTKNIPNARFVELNAAHLSNIEDAERFTREVVNFLNS
ncbi:MAG TPA: 3-oxoadipate enol-lactonase [Candidatus Acidoferrum sp.]|nr:3-oxoadipate enol-lactonase [Candidatus Acidoferrum sp.]